MKTFKLILLIVITFFTGYFMQSYKIESPKEEKLKELYRFLDKHYIDTINKDSLIDLSIGFLIGKLDPFSTYTSSENKSKKIDYTNKYYKGLGIEVQSMDDSIIIENILKNGPNYHKNLQLGDRLLALGTDTLTKENSFIEVYQEIVNTYEGKEIPALIYRGKKFLNLKLNIAEIETNNVKVATIIEEDLGYLKLDYFSERSLENVSLEVRKLESKGMCDLILDLRNNPGGLLSAAVKLSDIFLNKGKRIIDVCKKDSHKVYYTTENQIFENGNIYILVNSLTASSSEIVSSALQENDRATIVGRQTYGKGYIQEERRLSDGAIMRLTISEYYTALGRKIQKYKMAQDSIATLDQVNQENLSKVPTFKTNNGKIIYESGGIFPDVFVKYNYHNLPKKFIYKKGIKTLKTFAYHHINSKGKEYQNWTKMDFINSFDVQDLYQKWEAKYPFYNLNKEQAKIVGKYLKSYLALYLYKDISIYFKLKSKVDPDVLKVKELINLKNNPPLVGTENIQ